MSQKRCYFAHPMSDYNTERETKAVEIIENHGFAVLNPNSAAHEAGFNERGMQHFINLVLGCDALAFQRFPKGQIGAGVAKEIGAAAVNGLQIFEVTDEMLTEVALEDDELPGPILSVDETIDLLKSYGVDV